jgi:hypothetical protein
MNKNLSNEDKKIISNMFNQYVIDLHNMGCDKAKAIIIARQKVMENYELAIQCYK